MASRFYGTSAVFGALGQAGRLGSVWYNGLPLKTSPSGVNKTDEEPLHARKKLFDTCNLEGCFDFAADLDPKRQLKAACELFYKLQNQLGNELYKAQGLK